MDFGVPLAFQRDVNLFYGDRSVTSQVGGQTRLRLCQYHCLYESESTGMMGMSEGATWKPANQQQA